MKTRCLSAIVTALLVLTVLAACAPAAGPSVPQPTEPPAAPVPTQAPAPAPTQAPAAPAATQAPAAGLGGVPVIILDGEPSDLSPMMGQSRVTFTVLDEVNCFIARYDQQLKVIPSAASSWDVVDNKTMRINLKHGIKFHNGQEVTADDFKFSIEAQTKPEYGGTIAARLAAVDSVEVVDKYTAVIHLKEAYAPLLDVLIDRVPILPQSVYATPGAAKTQPVGCGPFKFKEWRKNSYITLDKNPDYFEPGLPKTDGLKFVFLPDYGAAKASLLSKESDVLLMGNLVDTPAMQAQSGIKVSAAPLLGYEWLGMNVTKAPFTDVRVRQAVKLAIDRQPIVDATTAGQGKPAFIPIPKTSPFYVPEVEYQPDIAKAKQLLTDAGFPNGFSVKVTVPQTAEEQPIGVVIQSQLKAVGINVDLEVLDVPAFIQRVFTNKDFAMDICGDTAGPDPAALLGSYYLSTSPTNIHNYKNAQMDDMLNKASSTFDLAERQKDYAAALKIAVDESPMVWLTQGTRVSSYQDYLSGFVNLPTLRYEFWNLQFVKPK